MARRLKRRVVPTMAVAVVVGACAVSAQAPVALSPEASRVVAEYRQRISGRFGALAVSTDGRRAAYHICQARLWKNCDDYSLNDRFVSIPSGKLAGQEALARCGGGCVILYMNEQEMRPYAAP